MHLYFFQFCMKNTLFHYILHIHACAAGLSIIIIGGFIKEAM